MKALKIGAVGLVVVGITLFVFAAALPSSTPGPDVSPAGGYSHDQLDADRVMTEQMSVNVGPAMMAGMPANGMLARSTTPGYVRALEQHAYQLDRMLARRP